MPTRATTRCLTIAITLASCGRSELAPLDSAGGPSDTGTTPACNAVIDAANVAVTTAHSPSCLWTGFSSPVSYAVAANPMTLALADIDADGHFDLVVTSGASAISVLT